MPGKSACIPRAINLPGARGTDVVHTLQKVAQTDCLEDLANRNVWMTVVPTSNRSRDLKRKPT